MRKAFLLACATLLYGGGNFVQAQTDVTATYLTNADFSATEGTTNVSTGICTYAKDVEGNGADGASLLTVSGWTVDNTNDAKAGGVFAYGSDTWLGGKDYKCPKTNPDGEASGNCLGITACWKCSGYYESANITLPAGTYSVIFKVYNTVGTDAIVNNMFGFVESGGTTHYGSTKNFTVGTWSEETVDFTLPVATSGKVRIGVSVGNTGGGTNQHLFVDNVKIMYTPLPLDEFQDALRAEITTAKSKKALGSDNADALATFNTAIETAETALTDATTEGELTSAIATLREAENTYIDATKLWADGTEYYIYNVAADQFLTAGSSWGTKAAVGGSVKMGFERKTGTQHVYTISTNSLYSGKYLGDNAFMDNGTAAEWTFEKVSGQEGVFMMKNGNNYLKKDDSGKGVSVSAGAPTDSKGYWKVYTKETLAAYALANADAENPVNMTAYIVNPDFPKKTDGVGINTGWDNLGSDNVKGAQDGSNSNYCAEHWHKTSWVSQTLTGLPAGKYTVKVQGFSTQGTGDAFVFAGEDETKLKYNGTAPTNLVTAATNLRTDGWWNEVTTTLHTSGDLMIGVRTSVNSIWILMDNFSISFLGADTSALLAEIDKANDLYDDGSGIGAAELMSAITTATGVSTTAHVTQEAVDAAVTALQTAENVYTSSQASLESPRDFTSAIGDADFSANTGKWSAYNLQYGVNENYNSAFDIKQTIALPAAGVYALGVQGFYRNGSSDNAYNTHFDGTEVMAQLYAGDNAVNLKSIMADALVSDDITTGGRSNVNGFYFPNDRNCANAYFTEGKYQNYLVFTADAAGEVTIGIKSTGTAGVNWSAFDNFTLKYYGQIATEAQVTAQVLNGTERQSISEAKRDATTATAYNTAKTAWEAVDASTKTAAEIRSANENVTKKALLAEVSAKTYAKLNSAIAEAEAYAEAKDYPGEEAYTAAIDEAKDAYNDGSYTDADVTDAVETLAAAKVAYVCSQSQSFAAPADYTDLLVNPSFETGDLTGWTKIASDMGGDNGVKENSNGTYTMSNVDGSHLFNTWNGDANEKRYGIYQTIPAPKTGWYSLSAVAGSDANNKITLTLGETTATITADAEGKGIGVVGETDKVYFEADDEILVKINSETWFKADNFQLAYYGDGVKVAMIVTDAQYGTFIAPFDVTVPSGVTASTVTGDKNGVLTLEEVENNTILANTPVVLYSEEPVNETLYGVEVEATNNLKEGYLTGVYTAAKAPVGSYVLQKQDAGVGFYKVAEDKQPTVGANRAYLTVSESAGVRQFFLFAGDTETGIGTAKAEGADEVIYDLSGRRVSKAVKGIYIINGKKIMK